VTAEERRPARFSAIVDAALVAWAARWPLYLGLALLSIAVELGISLLAHFDQIALILVLAVVDGFPTALVSIDVAARFRDEPLPLGEIFRRALLRWPIVVIVLVLILFIQALVFPRMFGSAEQTLYGLLILPALAVAGILGITTVIASIDESMPAFALPGYALLRAFFIASVWPNLGRLTFAGAMLAVPLMLQELFQRWLTSHGFAENLASFWANVPVDALVLAPFQAFFTLLYLDFVVRENRRAG
jgi:hypothetical protein